MNNKNKKVFLIAGIMAMSIIILLTLALEAYLIYRAMKNDEKLIPAQEINQDEATLDKNAAKPEIPNNLDVNKAEEKKDESTNDISNNNETLKSAGITNIKKKDLYDSSQTETISFDSAKFIIYPLENITGTEQEEGYFEAYQDINLIYSSDKLYKISNIFSFDYNTGTYIIATAYSGGAHCCFTQYIFYQDEKEKLTLVREMATNNTAISPDSFLVKNGNLYLSIMDDRFSYFYTSYASSYSYNQFYQLNKNNIALNNEPFKEDFIKEAKRCELDLSTINPSDIYSLEDWFPTLICKITNYWHAGDQDKAWDNFNDYFSKFKASENPSVVRQEMENILQAEY